MSNNPLKKESEAKVNPRDSQEEPLICWVDNLNLFSLAKVFLLSVRHKIVEVRYVKLNGWLSGFIKNLSYFKSVDLFRSLLSPHDEMAIENSTFKDNSLLARRIMPKYLNSGLPDLMDPRYSRKKVTLFLQQQLDKDLDRGIRFCNLIAALSSRDNNASKLRNIALIGNCNWAGLISEYFKDKQVALKSYFGLRGALILAYAPIKVLAEIVINALILILRRRGVSKKDVSASRVAVLHIQGAGAQKKTDYFWLEGSGIEREKLLLYFKYSVRPPDKNTLSFIAKERIPWVDLLPLKIGKKNIFGGTSELNVLPSGAYLDKLVKVSACSLEMFLYCLVKGRRSYFYFWAELTRLMGSVAFFEAFFLLNNIKVHFALYETGIDMVASNIAAEFAGAADLSTHWSNYDSIACSHGKYSDIYFSWGPYFKENFFNSSFNCVRNFVYTGYPYDSYFRALSVKAADHRKRLSESGARFIISFFDQNVVHDRPMWNKGVIDIYTALLGLVLENGNVGLIIKPKKVPPERKLPQLQGLLEKAGSTNRCLVLSPESFPSEAAQASDIAIGLGISSTPAIEAALAGKPAITYDIENSWEHPFYKDGNNRIIFCDLNRIIEILKESIAEGAVDHGIGDYSFILSRIDSFRDGMASKRIGSCIRSLLEGFDNGLNREEAIRDAISKYRSAWGEGQCS